MSKMNMKRANFIVAIVLFSTSVSGEVVNMAEEAQKIDQSKLEPLTTEQMKKINEAAPLTTISICKNQQVPSGYVIISEGSNAFCPGRFPNTWDIKQPSQFETVCKVSPIPNNYVIQGEGSNAFCPGRFPNTWDIRRI